MHRRQVQYIKWKVPTAKFSRVMRSFACIAYSMYPLTIFHTLFVTYTYIYDIWAREKNLQYFIAATRIQTTLVFNYRNSGQFSIYWSIICPSIRTSATMFYLIDLYKSQINLRNPLSKVKNFIMILRIIISISVALKCSSYYYPFCKISRSKFVIATHAYLEGW